MKKILFAIISVFLIGGLAYAQEAWFEAAESCAGSYEVNAAKEIPAQTNAQIKTTKSLKDIKGVRAANVQTEQHIDAIDVTGAETRDVSHDGAVSGSLVQNDNPASDFNVPTDPFGPPENAIEAENKAEDETQGVADSEDE